MRVVFPRSQSYRLIPYGRLWALSSYPLASPISSKCPKQKDPQGSTG